LINVVISFSPRWLLQSTQATDYNHAYKEQNPLSFKVIHVSDTHVGLTTDGVDNPLTGINTRAQDCLDALSYLVDYAIANNVKIILHSGDVFNDKGISLTYINAASAIIKRAADAGIFVYLLAGNHDSSRLLTRKNTIEHFATLHVKNVYVTRGGDYTDLGYCQVVSVPYWSTPEDIQNDINTLALQVDWTRPAFLVAHLQIDYAGFPGWFKDPSLQFVPAAALAAHPWTYVAVGHIHKNQQLVEDKHVYYAGSLVRCTFTEEHDPKGFMEFDVQGVKAVDVHLHEVECLRMLTLKGTMSDLRVALIKAKPKHFKNAIVRVLVDTTDEDIDDAFFKLLFAEAFKARVSKQAKTKELKKMDAVGLSGLNEYAEKYFEQEPRKKELMALLEEIKKTEESKASE